MSIAKAVKNKCIDCIYDPLAKGTALYQVTRCTFKDCSLYPYRSLDAEAKRLVKEEKIKNMTPEELKVYQDKQEKARQRMHRIRSLVNK